MGNQSGMDWRQRPIYFVHKQDQWVHFLVEKSIHKGPGLGMGYPKDPLHPTSPVNPGMGYLIQNWDLLDLWDFC